MTEHFAVRLHSVLLHTSGRDEHTCAPASTQQLPVEKEQRPREGFERSGVHGLTRKVVPAALHQSVPPREPDSLPRLPKDPEVCFQHPVGNRMF